MKNEPVVTYNHMQDDEPENSQDEIKDPVPISLYMILVADAVLISVLAFFVLKIIF